jgi:hypothetical protein
MLDQNVAAWSRWIQEGIIDSRCQNFIWLLRQSTVLKQMKLIHHGGYNDQERESYMEIIFSNTIQSMRCVAPYVLCFLSNRVSELFLRPCLVFTSDSHPRTMPVDRLSCPFRVNWNEVMARDVADAIGGLWRDPDVKEAVIKSRKFQLNDSSTISTQSSECLLLIMCQLIRTFYGRVSKQLELLNLRSRLASDVQIIRC